MSKIKVGVFGGGRGSTMVWQLLNHPDAELVATGVPMLRWHVAGSVFAGIVMLSTCLCQASGRALPALMLSLSRQGVVFFVVLLAAAALFGYQGILASQCAADVLSAVLAVCILLFGHIL